MDSCGAPFLMTESSISERLKRQYFKLKSIDVDSALAAGEEDDSESGENVAMIIMVADVSPGPVYARVAKLELNLSLMRRWEIPSKKKIIEV